jgi:hypothetical protein
LQGKEESRSNGKRVRVRKKESDKERERLTELLSNGVSE